MKRSPIIQLENINKSFSGDRVLEDINLSVYEGEFVALLGKSGSGKSTLLNILGLLDRPDSGKYILAGEEVSQSSEKEKDKLRLNRIGFIFQSSNMLIEHSVFTNASMGLRIQEVPYKGRKEKVGQLLTELELESKIDAQAKYLSGGERQRCAIARAVATQPDIILADEPTGNLDAENTARVMAILQNLNRAGHTIILVTHDPEVADLADRIVRIKDGSLTFEKNSFKAKANPAPSVRQKPVSNRLISLNDDLSEIFSNLTLKPLRTLLLCLAFALGIGGLVLSIGLSESAAWQVNKRLLHSESTTIRAAVSTAGKSETNLSASRENLSGLDYVENAYYRETLSANDVHVSRFSASDNEPEVSIGLIATTPDYLATKSISYLTPGSQDIVQQLADAGEGKSSAGLSEGAVVSRRAAQALGLGDETGSQLPQGLSIWIDHQRVPVLGIIDSQEIENEVSAFVLVPHSMLAHAEKANLDFYIKVEPGYVQAVSKAIPLTLAPTSPGSVLLETPSNITDLRAEISADLDIFLASLSGVLLVLAVFSASTAMYISVQSRTAEIALRRAIGAGRKQIAGLFLYEGLILGVSGGMFGVFLGQIITLVIAGSRGWEPVLNTWLVFLALVLGAVSGLVSACYPAWQASKKKPALAMRE